MIDLNDTKTVQRLLQALQQSGSTPDTTSHAPRKTPGDAPRRTDLPFMDASVSDAKANLSRYVRALEQRRARALVIRRNGERVALMISYEVDQT